jgi:hypothetical protein
MQSMLSPLVSTRLHKRDGTLVPFDAEKIQALIAAGTATGEYRRLTSTCYWCGAGRLGASNGWTSNRSRTVSNVC